jgi:hypothetical protein
LAVVLAVVLGDLLVVFNDAVSREGRLKVNSLRASQQDRMTENG